MGPGQGSVIEEYPYGNETMASLYGRPQPQQNCKLGHKTSQLFHQIIVICICYNGIKNIQDNMNCVDAVKGHLIKFVLYQLYRPFDLCA